jgi:hypothetical protein
MSSDKTESRADVWAARYDDRDAEDLACRKWAAGMTTREQAMAQPIKNFVIGDEIADDEQVPEEFAADESANDPTPH